MRVLYFKRNASSPIHIHAGSYADCFYIPDENIVLYREQHGTFGSMDYSLTDRAEILAEARDIAEGRIPNVEGVDFSYIKEFECENSWLQQLIQNIKLKAELQNKVEAGFENLLKQAGQVEAR